MSTDDPAGLSALYDRHGPAAFGLALRITRDPSLGTVKSRARLGLLALRAAIAFEYPRGQRPATARQPRA